MPHFFIFTFFFLRFLVCLLLSNDVVLGGHLGSCCAVVVVRLSLKLSKQWRFKTVMGTVSYLW